MRKLSGVVKNLQKKEESLGENGYFLALFDIENIRVRIRLYEPIDINENDKVSLAGDVKNGMLNVSAYYNLTTQISGNDRSYLSLFMGLITLIVGVSILIFKSIFGGVLAQVFAGILIFSGFYLVVRGVINYIAIKSLSKNFT